MVRKLTCRDSQIINFGGCKSSRLKMSRYLLSCVYLRAEGYSVFFAPESECQEVLSDRNQREVFYEIFGLRAKYVALFVSKNYILKEVPMEEAAIAIAKHLKDGSVLPIYLDGTKLPEKLFDSNEYNYFESDQPSQIASHLAGKMKNIKNGAVEDQHHCVPNGTMNIKNNKAEKQLFVQTFNGTIDF